MQAAWILALALVGSGVVIVGAGIVLARSADAIADVTGIERLWIGTVLLAAATSLPELATDVAAVRFGVPDLALGDLFGSSLANMTIFGAVELFATRRRAPRGATHEAALVGSLAIVLTAVAAALVLLREDVPLAGASLGTLLILVAYLVGTRAVFQESERQPAEGTTPRVRRALLRRTAVRFALAAGAILVAAPLFARAAKELAEITGLGPTFLGTALLGLATSAPELVTSFAAVRLGSVALAVGNLFGSNAFNMAILPVLDVVQPGAPLLATAHPAHALSGLFGVVSMGIAMAALFHRAERRYAFAIPASILLFANHALALWLVLARSAPP